MAVPWAAPMDAAEAKQYPRILTAMQLLEELSDNDSVWNGPPSEPDDADPVNFYRRFPDWPLKKGVSSRSALLRTGGSRDKFEEEERKVKTRSRVSEELPLDILPQGDMHDDADRKEQKFICVINLAIEDDDVFCFVKRLLGKSGNNMRRIAEECNAKVRLRGIGSGFLEGREQKEANMPLNLSISCTKYDEYVRAIRQARTLLKDLYKHFRRFIRSQGTDPPELHFNIEEVRRDDHCLDLLAEKAARTEEQRTADRLMRRQEKLQKSLAHSANLLGLHECQTSDSWAKFSPSSSKALPGDFKRSVTHDSWEGHFGLQQTFSPKGTQQVAGLIQAEDHDDSFTPFSTPAGRRAARGAGGAALAAKAAAAARQCSLDRRKTEWGRPKRSRQGARDRRQLRRAAEAEAWRAARARGPAWPDKALPAALREWKIKAQDQAAGAFQAASDAA